MLRTIPFASTLLMAALAFIPGVLRSQPPGALRAIGAIQPRISPDGSSIAVSYQGAIWRIGREGGEMRRLTSVFGFDANPAWSSDGKRIAYFNCRALRMVDAETGSAAAVPNGVQGSG